MYAMCLDTGARSERAKRARSLYVDCYNNYDEAPVRSRGTRGSDRTHRANEIERGGKFEFDGLDGGWRLRFGLLLGARL